MNFTSNLYQNKIRSQDKTNTFSLITSGECLVSQDEQEEVKGHIRFPLVSLTAAVSVPGVSPCPFKVMCSFSSGQLLCLLILQAGLHSLLTPTLELLLSVAEAAVWLWVAVRKQALWPETAPSFSYNGKCTLWLRLGVLRQHGFLLCLTDCWCWWA